MDRYNTGGIEINEQVQVSFTAFVLKENIFKNKIFLHEKYF